jgi:AcrR family transcriptional regulator
VAGTRTREALLEHGALLFARHGVAGVTARQLHEAIGSRNESALHYHFGDKAGLVNEILRVHLEATEARRAKLVVRLAADERTGDLRALVHALAAPMAEDLAAPLGRAHLRLVARATRPALAYERPFQMVEAPAGLAIVRWLWAALPPLPEPILRERLAALRSQLVVLIGRRAQLLDDDADHHDAAENDLFLENLVDMLVAGLTAPPSKETLAASNHEGAGPSSAADRPAEAAS